MCSTICPRNPLRTTSLKTTFRLSSNDYRWRRSPATSRSRGEVESSRCCTRYALGGTLRTVLGAEKRPPTLSHPQFALLGQHSGPASPNQPPFRRIRIGAVQRELSRNNGERFLAPDYACVPLAEWLHRNRDTVLPKGAHFWYKGDDGLWWLGQISWSTTEDGIYLTRDWTTWGRSSFLFIRRATRPQRGPYEGLGAFRST